jgi:hypothetical protein
MRNIMNSAGFGGATSTSQIKRPFSIPLCVIELVRLEHRPLASGCAFYRIGCDDDLEGVVAKWRGIA